jgi:transketolase
MVVAEVPANPVRSPVRSTKDGIDQLCVSTIRTLAMDAVQAANSGHPGTPMALAPVAYCLWQRVLRFDPNHPIWPNRDRFVLSVGHASMLLYAMLHLSEIRAVNPKYETLGEPSVTLDDIKRFRQLDSKCPGHPEYRWTSGVETTTGPLGQGLATSVGMAIAERWLASYFNRPGFDLFDYDVYALCGDGCMMEGVSGEAASLAGHLKLNNLCWIYDNNHITIEGNTALAYSDDVATRFIGLGWNVTRVGDANDLEMLERAFRTFKSTSDRPTLIIVDSHIAYGVEIPVIHVFTHDSIGVGEDGPTHQPVAFGASAPLKELQKKFGLHSRKHRRCRETSDRESELNDAHCDRFRSCRISSERSGQGILTAEHRDIVDLGTHSPESRGLLRL